jgi:hypothetical protein
MPQLPVLGIGRDDVVNWVIALLLGMTAVVLAASHGSQSQSDPTPLSLPALVL